jgi:hypothetical protein
MTEETKQIEFSFDLTERTRPVTIGGRDYLIVEADSETAQEFHALVMGGCVLTQMTEGNKIEKLAGIARSQNYLVSRCLKEIVEGRRKDIPLAVVSGWPHRITKPIYEECRKISGLVEDDKTRAATKNS